MENLTIEPTRRGEFWAGVKATFPLVVGAIPFGIVFGAIAVMGGMTPAGTQAMSVFVFAGSSQFIAAGLAAAGTGVLVIIATTLIVNLRHALYAATLAPHMKDLPHRWLLPLGFWLTDESFVVVAQRFQRGDPSAYKHWFFLGSALFMYTNWQLCTFIGLRVGQAIDDPLSWGLDFAMVVTFIGMVVPLIKDRAVLSSVVVAGVVAALADGLPHKLGLMAAALSGILAGYLASQYWPTEENLGDDDE